MEIINSSQVTHGKLIDVPKRWFAKSGLHTAYGAGILLMENVINFNGFQDRTGQILLVRGERSIEANDWIFAKVSKQVPSYKASIAAFLTQIEFYKRPMSFARYAEREDLESLDNIKLEDVVSGAKKSTLWPANIPTLRLLDTCYSVETNTLSLETMNILFDRLPQDFKSQGELNTCYLSFC